MTHDNLEAMRRADDAAALRGLLGDLINGLVSSTLSTLVAYYRGAEMHHDVMIGKVAEISALLGILDHIDGAMRAGETAREREFGNGKAKADPRTRS